MFCFPAAEDLGVCIWNGSQA